MSDRTPPGTIGECLTYSGYTLTVYEVECSDCGFITGIAHVVSPTGYTRMMTGAGCRSTPRRGPREAMAWAKGVADSGWAMGWRQR